MRKLVLLFAIAAPLTGCSIHPLPEDVTRHATFDIVKSIRCEAIDGIRKLVRNGEIKPDVLPATFIGYDFQFLITENNNAFGSGVFRYPFSSGTFTMGVSAGAERARNSDRSFRIIESFKELLDGEAACLNHDGKANRDYPIAGSIGLNEVITTYVRLEELTTLRPLETKSADKKDGGKKGGQNKEGQKDIRELLAEANQPPSREPVQTFADKLTFTTKLKGGLKPSVVLSAVPGSFRLVDAVADLSVDRIDVHKVTVAIAVDREAMKGKRLNFFELYSERRAPLTYYNAFAPSPLQEASGARARVLLELDRQRLLDLDAFKVTP